MAIQPANPLEQFVLEALQKQGWDKLKAEDQEVFFPQFVVEAERRLGLAMAPHLNEQAGKDFQDLLQKESTPADWFAFWQSHVPDFVNIVKKTLEDFASEMTATINA